MNLVEDLNHQQYSCLYVDCPWSFRVWSPRGEGRSASQHYSTMSLAEIKALGVPAICAPDCALFLWAIDPMLPQALEVMTAWGFTFKSVAFYWVKENLKSPGFSTGMGFWTRANPEQCLLGTRGKPKRLSKGVKRLVIAPRQEHSRKPEGVRRRIEALVPGPRLELFARESAPGWSSWGLEAGKFPAPARRPPSEFAVGGLDLTP